MSHRDIAGFTFIEIMVVLSIVAILAAISTPTVGQYLDNTRLKDSAETLQSSLVLGRSIALNRSQDVYVSFTQNAQGETCHGVSLLASCNCFEGDVRQPQACTISDVSGTSSRLTSVLTATPILVSTLNLGGALSTAIQIDSKRGVTDAGTITFTAPGGEQLSVIQSPLGRVRICNRNGMPAYSAC